MVRAQTIEIGDISSSTTLIVHQHFYDGRLGADVTKRGISAATGQDTGDSLKCPYRGLATFRTIDADLFFGRERETGLIVEALEQHNRVTVIASSGAGKSSLVHAGVLPKLARQSGKMVWDIFSFKPGREPLKEFSRSLAGAFGPYCDMDEEIEQINRRAQNMRKGDVSLCDLFEHLRQMRQATHDGKEHRILVFIDQWEELYTQIDNPKDRDILIRELDFAIKQKMAKLLLTMRVDFIGEVLEQDPVFFKTLKPGIQYLNALSEEGLRAAIERPAQAVGLRVPDGLTGQMIKEVLGQPGHLPYLQFTLEQLWEQRDTIQNALTLKAYEGIGGITGAIGKHANGAYQKLTEKEQRLARVLMPRLIHVSELGSDISIRQPFSSFSETEQALFRNLAGHDKRLVVLHGDPDAGEEAVTVEIAHEALIRDWKKLQGWITEREEFMVLRGKFDADAATWKRKGRDPDYLIPAGKPLLSAQKILHDAGSSEISNELISYIEFSKLFHEENLRKKNKAEKENDLKSPIGDQEIPRL